MSDEDKEKAAIAARRARKQGASAAKNAGRAVRFTAEPVVEDVAEELRDAGDKLEATAEDAIQTARRINPWVLSRISSDTGIGFFALSVSIYAGAIAFNKFRGAYSGRSYVLDPVAKQ